MQLLQADEAWHCTACGWPVPTDSERVKREIQIRELAAKTGIRLDRVEQRAELDRLLRRGRRISLTGLAVSLIMVTMSLAQVFGLVSRPPPLYFAFFLGFVFSVTIGLIIMARQQMRMFGSQ